MRLRPLSKTSSAPVGDMRAATSSNFAQKSLSVSQLILLRFFPSFSSSRLASRQPRDEAIFETGSSQKSPGAYWWYAAIAALCAGVIAFFVPLLREYPAPRIASTYPDALEFIWTTWRLEGVLAGEKSLYHSREIFAPSGASLLLHTVCEGVLVPITAVFRWLDPIWRYNTALVVTCLVSALAAISLFRAVGCGPLAAAVASALVIVTPSNLGHLHAGHLNFIALFGLIEVVRGITIGARLTARQPKLVSIDALRYAGAVTLVCFTNLYYLYFAALLVGVALLFALLTKRTEGRSWVHEGLLLSLPFIAGLSVALPHLIDVARLASSGTYSADHRAATHGADLVTLITPSAMQRIGQHPLAVALRSTTSLHVGESSLYLGCALIAAALCACVMSVPGESIKKARRCSRFFALVALIFAILSCGPTISWRGSPLLPNPLDIALRSTLPFFPSVPARFAGLTSLTLIIAASQLLATHNTRRVRWLGIVLFAVASVEFLPIRLSVHPLPLPSPTLMHLRDEQTPVVVADLSMSPQYAMLRQTIHGKPIVGGFLSRHPRREATALRRNRFIQVVQGRTKSDTTEALRSWCDLRATRLLLELPVAHAHSARLAELGFVELVRDPYVVLFAPRTGVCEHDNHPLLEQP